MPDETTFQDALERIEGLIQQTSQFADPNLQGHVQEIVRLLLDWHRMGLERLLEHVAQTGTAGTAAIEAAAGDEVVANLLLLHDLHPRDVRERVAEALETVRPYLQSHKGNVELIGVDEGVVRLRMQGSCDGCPSSAATLKLTIEEAIYQAAPDVIAIEVEGLTEPQSPPAAMPAGFVPLEQLASGNARLATSTEGRPP